MVDEASGGLAELVNGVMQFDPQALLLEGADPALGAAVGFRLTEEGGVISPNAGDGAMCRASSHRWRDRADVVDAAGRYDQPVTKDELLAHCLSKPGAWQDEPWEGDTVVKVGPKIFAFLGSGDGAATHGSVGVKCAVNRDAADEWLKLYPDDASVMAYLGRSGWNALRFGGAIPDEEVLDAVEESYRMIVARLPKKDRPA